MKELIKRIPLIVIIALHTTLIITALITGPAWLTTVALSILIIGLGPIVIHLIVILVQAYIIDNKIVDTIEKKIDNVISYLAESYQF